MLRRLVEIFTNYGNRKEVKEQLNKTGWFNLYTLKKEELEKEIATLQADKTLNELSKNYVIGFARTSLPQLPFTDEDYDKIARDYNVTNTGFISLMIEKYPMTMECFLYNSLAGEHAKIALTFLTCCAIRAGADARYWLRRYIIDSNAKDEISFKARIAINRLAQLEVDFLDGVPEVQCSSEELKTEDAITIRFNEFWKMRETGKWDYTHNLEQNGLIKLLSHTFGSTSSSFIKEAKEFISAHDYLSAAEKYVEAAKSTDNIPAKLMYYLSAFEQAENHQTKQKTLVICAARIMSEILHALRKLIELNLKNTPKTLEDFSLRDKLQAEYKKCHDKFYPIIKNAIKDIKTFAQQHSLEFEPRSVEEKAEHKKEISTELPVVSEPLSHAFTL